LSIINFKQIIKDYFTCIISRREVLIIYTWTTLIGLLITNKGFPPVDITIITLATISFTGMAVYFYNDMKDYEDDMLDKEHDNSTHSNRPLGQGKITLSRLNQFIFINGILGLATAYMINVQVFALMVAFNVLGYLYSTEPFLFKKRFLMKQATIALGGLIACILGGFASGLITPNLIFFAGMSFFMFFGVNPIIDLRDLEGDKVVGVKTFPVIWGPKFTVRLALATLTASILANVIGFYQFGFSSVLPILGAIILGATIFVIQPLLNKWEDSTFLNYTITKRMHPLFLLIQLCYLIGSIPLNI